MSDSRMMPLDSAAAGALVTILGIMLDHIQLADFEGFRPPWSAEHVVDLDTRLNHVWPELTASWSGLAVEGAAAGEVRPVELHIEDAELLLAGMAFTEMASTELPWFDMVRWTSDFISSELRGLWSDEVWRSRAGAPRG